jgi:hypothetical protein
MARCEVSRAEGSEKVLRGKKRDAMSVWPVVSPITLLERIGALFE